MKHLLAAGDRPRNSVLLPKPTTSAMKHSLKGLGKINKNDASF
jgi:hypothetical protein